MIPFLPNPWFIVAGVLLLAGVSAFSYSQGRADGRNAEIVKQESDEALIRKTREAAQIGAADAISNIKIENKNITRNIETLVRTDIVYRDCHHNPVVMRLLEDIRSGSDPAAAGKLRSSVQAPKR